MGAKARPAEFVVRNGRPKAVILDIQVYEDILERLEDAEDLAALRAMRRKPLRFRKLADYLKERSSRV